MSGVPGARAQYRGAMSTQEITFRTRQWAEPEDRNADGTLFGGSPLRRIDQTVFVGLDRRGRPAPRGCTETTGGRDRIPTTARPVLGERSA